MHLCRQIAFLAFPYKMQSTLRWSMYSSIEMGGHKLKCKRTYDLPWHVKIFLYKNEKKFLLIYLIFLPAFTWMFILTFSAMLCTFLIFITRVIATFPVSRGDSFLSLFMDFKHVMLTRRRFLIILAVICVKKIILLYFSFL